MKTKKKIKKIKVRRGWGELCPATKIIPDKTKYNRKSKKGKKDIDGMN